MTVIAAIRDPATGRAVVGADRRVTEEGSIIVTMAEPKIQQTDSIIFGSAGGCRPPEIIDPILLAYDRHVDGPLLMWLRAIGSSLIQAELKSRRWFWHPGARGNPEDYDFGYLMADREGLYTLQSTLESHPIYEPYYAVGSGRELAMGAMAALHGHEDLPEIINSALDVAARHDPGVGAPFDVLQIG